MFSTIKTGIGLGKDYRQVGGRRKTVPKIKKGINQNRQSLDERSPTSCRRTVRSNIFRTGRNLLLGEKAGNKGGGGSCTSGNSPI